jgi:hypothetical protein
MPKASSRTCSCGQPECSEFLVRFFSLFKTPPTPHRMSALQRLNQSIDHKLGAWIARDEDFAEHPANPPDFETKARTFLCFLENVFGRFYEFKTRICDYDDIPDTYGADWERFRTDACAAAKEGKAFNGICAVMHLQTAAEGDAYVIRNVGIRPCAIEQSFFRVLLRHMALSLEGRPLVIKIFGIRVEFVNTVIANLKAENPGFKEPTRTKEDRKSLMGTNAFTGDGRVSQIDVITFESATPLQSIRVPWTTNADPRFPTAAQLNDSSSASPNRVELLRRMIGGAQQTFGQYLKSANDTTNYLPDALNLEENALWVYKGGVKMSFRPEERRFFVKDVGPLYAEVCLWGGDKYVENLDSVQARKTIRIEFADGKFVFFLLPQDFARRAVPYRQKIRLEGRDSVQRVVQAIAVEGEKVLGVDGGALVLSAKQAVENSLAVIRRP